MWLGFASADVGWVVWIEVVITKICRKDSPPFLLNPPRETRRVPAAYHLTRFHSEHFKKMRSFFYILVIKNGCSVLSVFRSLALLLRHGVPVHGSYPPITRAVARGSDSQW